MTNQDNNTLNEITISKRQSQIKISNSDNTTALVFCKCLGVNGELSLDIFTENNDNKEISTQSYSMPYWVFNIISENLKNVQYTFDKND